MCGSHPASKVDRADARSRQRPAHHPPSRLTHAHAHAHAQHAICLPIPRAGPSEQLRRGKFQRAHFQSEVRPRRRWEERSNLNHPLFSFPCTWKSSSKFSTASLHGKTARVAAASHTSQRAGYEDTSGRRRLVDAGGLLEDTSCMSRHQRWNIYQVSGAPWMLPLESQAFSRAVHSLRLLQ